MLRRTHDKKKNGITIKIRVQPRRKRSIRYAFTCDGSKGLVGRELVKEGQSLKEVGGVFAFLGG